MHDPSAILPACGCDSIARLLEGYVASPHKQMLPFVAVRLGMCVRLFSPTMAQPLFVLPPV